MLVVCVKRATFFAVSLRFKLFSSVLLSVMLPLYSIKLAMPRSKVVLPQPFGPIMLKLPSIGKSNDMPLTISDAP